MYGGTKSGVSTLSLGRLQWIRRDSARPTDRRRRRRRAWAVRRLNPGGVEIFCALRAGPDFHPAFCKWAPHLSRGNSDWNMTLFTHLLVPGCEWVDALSSPPICAYIAMSGGNFMLKRFVVIPLSLYTYFYNRMRLLRNGQWGPEHVADNYSS
jgi:hypothetical protein